MKAVGFSGILVTNYEDTRRHIPEDNNIHFHCPEKHNIVKRYRSHFHPVLLYLTSNPTEMTRRQKKIIVQ
jgi:hypothetical protein